MNNDNHKVTIEVTIKTDPALHREVVCRTPSDSSDPQTAHPIRIEIDPWEELVSAYLVGKNETTNNEIGSQCLNLEPPRLRASERRIGRILRRLGWEPAVVHRDKGVFRLWMRGKTDVTSNSL